MSRGSQILGLPGTVSKISFTPMRGYIRREGCLFGLDVFFNRSCADSPLSQRAANGGGYLPLVVKFTEQHRFAKEVVAADLLQSWFTKGYPGVVTLIGRDEVNLMLLYPRVAGTDLKRQFRAALIGSWWNGMAEFERHLDMAASWLAGFQRESAPLTESTMHQDFGTSASFLSQYLEDSVSRKFLPFSLHRHASQLTNDLTLPWERCLCHGDFMLPNIVTNAKNFNVIDWENLHVGHPLTDVARMVQGVLSQARLFPFSGRLALRCVRRFLESYTQHSGLCDGRFLITAVLCAVIGQMRWQASRPHSPVNFYYVPQLRRLVGLMLELAQQSAGIDDVLSVIG